MSFSSTFVLRAPGMTFKPGSVVEAAEIIDLSSEGHQSEEWAAQALRNNITGMLDSLDPISEMYQSSKEFLQSAYLLVKEMPSVRYQLGNWILSTEVKPSISGVVVDTKSDCIWVEGAPTEPGYYWVQVGTGMVTLVRVVPMSSTMCHTIAVFEGDPWGHLLPVVQRYTPLKSPPPPM